MKVISSKNPVEFVDGTIEYDDGVSGVMVVVAHNRGLKHMCTHIYAVSLSEPQQ